MSTSPCPNLTSGPKPICLVLCLCGKTTELGTFKSLHHPPEVYEDNSSLLPRAHYTFGIGTSALQWQPQVGFIASCSEWWYRVVPLEWPFSPLSFSRQPGAVALGGAFQMHINLEFLVDPYGACRLLGLLSALLTHGAQLELCSSHKSLTVLASQFCKSMCVFPPCPDVRFPTNVCELPLKPQNPPSNLLAISCKNGTLSIIFKSQTPILPAIILWGSSPGTCGGRTSFCTARKMAGTQWDQSEQCSLNYTRISLSECLVAFSASWK